MIKRDIITRVKHLLLGFPVVTITGPRQSGKTTLARSIFKDKPYLSLEDPDIRQQAIDDPRGFLAGIPDGAVLDEVQRTPELFSYLQTHLDNDGRMGLFLLTGSQQFGLLSQITQSLAGRTAFVELLPFSINELQTTGHWKDELDATLLFGGYPPLYDRGLSPSDWMPAYVRAYVERDVRQLLNVHDLETFQRFIRLCAGRSGQILNLSSLATDAGITHNTIKSWLSVLEASYILFLMRPHQENFRKRMVKSPKLYFYDTGLLCWLLGIREAQQIATHPLRGNIFETFIITELMKSRLNSGKEVSFHFWRDSNGNEIDLIVDNGAAHIPIEIKSGQTLNRDFFTGLRRWHDMAGNLSINPALIFGGRDQQVRNGIRVYGWRDVSQVL